MTGLGSLLPTYTPATVVRTYTPFIDDDAFDAALTASHAMLVFVVPMRKATALETRAEDQNDYSFRIVFAEKCRDRGLPSNTWMDTRVGAVDAAEDYYGDTRNAFDSTNGKLFAVESEVAIVFDSAAHAEEGTFWSVWHLTLREYA